MPLDGSAPARNLTPENIGNDDGPRFAPDGRSVVFTRTQSNHFNGESPKLWRHDLAPRRNSAVTEDLDYGVGEVEFGADGKTFWILAEDEGVVPVFRLAADGKSLMPIHAG